jgi:hypothetical protein
MASVRLFDAHSNRVGAELNDNILRRTVIQRNQTSAVWPIANALKCNPNPKSQSTIRAQLPVEGGRWQRKSFDCKFTELYSVVLPRLPAFEHLDRPIAAPARGSK